MPGYNLLICEKEIFKMYDNLVWDDVFQVWVDPDAAIAEAIMSDEELADIAERGFDNWLYSLAGIL